MPATKNRPEQQPPAVRAAAQAPIPDRTQAPIRVQVRDRIRAAVLPAVPAKRTTEYAQSIQTARRGTNVATAAMNAENANPAVIWRMDIGTATARRPRNPPAAAVVGKHSGYLDKASADFSADVFICTKKRDPRVKRGVLP